MSVSLGPIQIQRAPADVVNVGLCRNEQPAGAAKAAVVLDEYSLLAYIVSLSRSRARMGTVMAMYGRQG